MSEKGTEIECAYCEHLMPAGVWEVPAVDDDVAWAEEAKNHHPCCEWWLTRAHQREHQHHEDFE